MARIQKLMSRRRAHAPLATAAPIAASPPLLNAMVIGRGILFLPFFTTRDARHVRGVCRELRALVQDFAWDDRTLESRVAARVGAVVLWRVCFPRAVACTLFQGDLETYVGNEVVTDGDLALLRGVRSLDIGGCENVTDVGLAHVASGHGLHTLKMISCWEITDAGFAQLAGIHTLHMVGCDQDTITDAAFAHLAGIHTLYMVDCNQATITDVAFAHLAGIHTLYMADCNQVTITDTAFTHLAGIYELSMEGCNQATITDVAFVHLAGIHTLYMEDCNQATITEAALAHLAGIHTLMR